MLDIVFDQFPELQTRRLLLRNIKPSDAPALFRIRSDARVMRYLGRPMQKEIAEAEQMVQNFIRAFEQNEGLNWVVSLLEAPEELIGTIGFWRLDKANHRAEIGYALSADYWRRGIMDEAMKAVLAYGFQVLHFHSIEANTDPENDASGSLLEKNGFEKEAFFRENYYFEGRFLDSRIYSKLNPYHESRTTNAIKII